MIRTIIKLVSINLANLPAFKYYGLSLPFIAGNIEAKYLREYRCPKCNKLLGKGHLQDKYSFLEIKCRGCSGIYTFSGEDREILKVRSKLLKKGKIPDTE